MARQSGFGDDLAQALGQLGRLDGEMADVPEVVAAAGAQLVAAEAKRRAPVRTGALRDSIGSREGEAGPGRAEAEVFVGAFYGYWIEYGRRGVGAQAFLRPAADYSRRKIRKLISSELRLRTRKVSR